MSEFPSPKPPSRPTLTVLKLGEVEIPVGVYKATADAKKLVKFDTGGPNGGRLKAETVARPVPVEEPVEAPVPVQGDPLGDGKPAAPDVLGAFAAAAGLKPAGEDPDEPVVDAEYGMRLVEEGTGEVVLPQDVRRGVRLDDGGFVDCTEQLAAIEERTKLEKMEIRSFVGIAQVPRARVVASHYVGVGDAEAAKPLRLLLEAMKSERRCALVKWTKRSRQSLGVIGWLGECLMLYEIEWAECFRPAPAKARAVMQAQVAESEVETARQLVQAMADSPAAMDELRDDAVALREELRARALAGEVPDVIEPVEPEDPNADLMAQLEETLAQVAA